MLYGRFGEEIAIVFGDVERGYARIKYQDDGSEDDAHFAYLRADGGLSEIIAAVEAANERRQQEYNQAVIEHDRDL